MTFNTTENMFLELLNVTVKALLLIFINPSTHVLFNIKIQSWEKYAYPFLNSRL